MKTKGRCEAYSLSKEREGLDCFGKFTIGIVVYIHHTYNTYIHTITISMLLLYQQHQSHCLVSGGTQIGY